MSVFQSVHTPKPTTVVPSKGTTPPSKNEQKYRNLIRSLMGLVLGMGLTVAGNYQLSHNTTVATEHMDIIGEISDTMFQLAADAQQLSLVDGTQPDEANRLIEQLKTKSQDIDGYLNSLTKYEAKETAMQQFAKQWQDYRSKINALKIQQFGEAADITQRIELARYAYQQKDPLYDLFAQGYDTYLQETYRNGQYTKILQLLTLLGLLGYLWFFVHYTFRRMRAADAEVQRVEQETIDIMRSVNEGLFLIDKSLVIGEQHSSKLEQLLQQKNLSGRNLLDILDGMISRADMETTKLYVEQLYNSWVVEELIQDLNPLKQVLLSYIDDNGISDTKFLSFNFSRVIDEQDKVTKVFVSVVDVTHEVELQLQMQKDKQQHDRQIEMIRYLLTIDIRQVLDFVTETRQRLAQMNELLKSDSKQDYSQKAQQLFRLVHSLKGDASAIQLDTVVSLAESQETKLKNLLQQSQIRGNDFLGFTIGLNELIETVEFIEQLLQRLQVNSVQPSDVPANSTSVTQSSSPYWQNFFSHYAEQIAQRHHKQVALHVQGFDDLSLSSSQQSLYKDLAMQLLKNAIVHGIETPAQRQAQHKPAVGQLVLALTDTGSHHELRLRDDGQGIDWQQIRQAAIEQGKITADTVLQPKALMALMLSSGISTAKQQDEDAGRGVGMDIVRQLVADHQGRLSLSTQPQQYTEFTIRFPQVSGEASEATAVS